MCYRLVVASLGIALHIPFVLSRLRAEFFFYSSSHGGNIGVASTFFIFRWLMARI